MFFNSVFIIYCSFELTYRVQRFFFTGAYGIGLIATDGPISARSSSSSRDRKLTVRNYVNE